MRPIYLAAPILISLFFSCEKPETDLSLTENHKEAVLATYKCSENSSERYIPLCIGNSWSYDVEGTDILSINCEILSDTMINRKNYYYSFYDLPWPSNSDKKLNMTYENGRYYVYIWDRAKWMIFDEEAEIGDTWTACLYFGKTNYYTSRFTVDKKYESFEVNGKVLNNVTEMKQEFEGGDDYYSTYLGTSKYNYAKGIGLISINHLKSNGHQINYSLTDYYVQ